MNNSKGAKPVKSPPRNWKRYKWCYFLHHFQGAVIGGIVWWFPLAALVLLITVLSYQICEYVRQMELLGRGDTLRRDVFDVSFAVFIYAFLSAIVGVVIHYA